MSNYLPKQLNHTWKNYWFSLQYQSLIIESINAHVSAIEAICQAPQNEILEQFKDKSFWEDLKSESLFDPKILEIETQWQSVSELAHLNAKQLLILLEEEVIPLENAYSHLKVELEANSSLFRTDTNYQLLCQNLDNLKELKDKIYQGLLFRCQIHDILKKYRNVDDVLLAFCHKLTLPLPQVTSASLNDDRRLMIYDILSRADFERENLKAQIIAVIPKRGPKASVSRQNILIQMNKTNKFCQKILNELDLRGHGRYLFNAASLDLTFLSHARLLGADLYQKIAERFKDTTLSSIAQIVWRLRYGIYLIASLAAYHYVAFLLQPFLMGALGLTAFSAASTALFYTLGVAPLWYLGWTMIDNLGQETKQLLLRNKKMEIVVSLSLISQVEYFLSNKLRQNIVDLAHYDLDHLLENVSHFLSKMETVQTQLNTYQIWENYLSKGAIQSHISGILNKFNDYRENIKTLLAERATHIAKQVGKEIELLRVSLETGVSPAFPKDQLHKLQSFVEAYGSEEAKATFQKNTDVMTKWFSELQKSKLFADRRTDLYQHGQPWGGSDIAVKTLKGWQIILEAFISDPLQRNACLTLNALLMGTTALSQDDFEACLDHLKLEKSRENIKQEMGVFIFNTLHHRLPQHASFLPEAHKGLIQDWYQNHQAEITMAKEAITKIINIANHKIDELDIPDNENWSEYFELLDALAIYAHASGNPELVHDGKNRVRHYLSEYQGQHSFVLRLIKLIPANERDRIIVEVAQKRLNWKIEHLGQSTVIFDSIDDELFNNPNLQKLKHLFKFSEFIRDCAQFKLPWRKNFDEFLEKCVEKGFVGQSVLDQYALKSGKPKTKIQQHQYQQHLATCAAEPKEDNSLTDSEERKTVHALDKVF